MSTEELPSRSVGAAALSIVWVKSAGLVTIRPPTELTDREFDKALVLSTKSPEKKYTFQQNKFRTRQFNFYFEQKVGQINFNSSPIGAKVSIYNSPLCFLRRGESCFNLTELPLGENKFYFKPRSATTRSKQWKTIARTLIKINIRFGRVKGHRRHKGHSKGHTQL